MRYHCGCCGKCVTSSLPEDSVIRAFLVCPECIGNEKIIFPEIVESSPEDKPAKEVLISPRIQGQSTKGWSTTICPSCSGAGRVEDPHHGHDMRCEKCGGTGVAKTG